MGDLREPDGGAAAGDDRVSTLPWTSLSSNSSPSSIPPESLEKAEKSIQKIIFKVLPTFVSEERRNKVIDYVQRLLRTSIGCEVVPYGSVPLKTYLPDGDIDLTVFGGLFSDVLVKDVISVLEAENQNNAAEFVVKDVQHIGAEVKIVKCIVQNIVVDITFNQIGGLSTLCFFEQVDRLIGKENLFKQSIILIKAWCYYESRILGGHHGLISTYALETLVLYIFHLFHSSLNDPLTVLYKFLDYYSKFEWENYCISIFGPIRLSSLHDFVVEKPDNGGNNLLLTSEFVGHFVNMFSVPSKGVDLKPHVFQMKHLNIMDPLKKTNNLGRCVNQASFFRIRSAFTYGAKKLSQILMHPENDIDDGLCKFFFNTLNRHGSGRRPDVQGSICAPGYMGFGPMMRVSETGSSQKERVIFQTEFTSSVGTAEDCGSAPDGSFHNAVSGYKRYGSISKEKEDTVGVLPSKILAEDDQNMMGKGLDERIFGDAEDLATSRFEYVDRSNDFPKYQDLAQESSAHFVPHLYFSNSMLSNGDKGSPSSHKIQMDICKKGVSCESDGDNGFSMGIENDVLISAGLENVDLAKNAVPQPENPRCVSLQSASASTSVPESLSPIPDLSGDYDNHFNYLLYGWSCYQYALGMAPLPVNALPPYLFQLKNLWDAAQQSSQFNQSGFSHVSVNGGIPVPPLYTGNPVVIPGVFFGLEEVPKPRGTGTFLPSMNRPVQTFKHSSTRGRNPASSRSPRNNNRNTMFTENVVLDQSSPELSQSPLSVDQSASKPGHPDVNPSFSPRGKVQANANALVLQAHGGFELLPVGNVAAPLLERGKQRHQKSPTSSPKNSGPVSPSNVVQRFKPVRDYDRLSMKSSYHLKDNEDFPPLSL